MLKRIVENRTFVQACAVLTAVMAAAGKPAYADSVKSFDPAPIIDELFSTMAVEPSPFHDAPIELGADKFEFSAPQPSVMTFVEICATLNAIPLMELSTLKARRVFIGISFDGLFGIHARL